MITRRQALVSSGSVMLVPGAAETAWAATDPVKIGSVMPVSMTFSEQSRRGMELKVKELNAAGGILGGRKIELITYDDQNKPEEAAAATERLISRDKVSVILGSITTPGTAAVLAVTKRYRKMHISASAKSETLRENGHANAFFTNTTVSQDATKYNEFIANDLKLKRVAMLAELTDYGEGAIAQLKKSWSTPGSPQIVTIERINPKDTDHAAMLTKVKAMNPDGLYICLVGADIFANLLRQIDELGVPGTKLPGPGVMALPVVKAAGRSVEGVIFGDFYANNLANPENKAFVAAFSTAYGYPPEKMELLGYEAVEVAAGAVAAAGPNGGNNEIAAATRDGEWDTPRGKWRFAKYGASFQAPASFVLLTVKNGEIIPFTGSR